MEGEVLEARSFVQRVESVRVQVPGVRTEDHQPDQRARRLENQIPQHRSAERTLQQRPRKDQAVRGKVHLIVPGNR